MEIKAAVVKKAHEKLNIETLIMDDIRDDEVLVKMVSAGICRTDIDVRDQYIHTPLPVVLGHEGAGVVVNKGSRVNKVEVGDSVILSLSSCGECEKCKTGQPAFCLKHVPLNFGGSRLDGSVCLHDHDHGDVHSHFFGQSSHASYAVVNASSLIKITVKDQETLKYFGPFACGIMTGAGGVFNTMKPEAGSSVVIFGLGAVGLSAVMAARIAGCRSIIAVDLSEKRLALAQEMGATHLIPGNHPDIVGEVKRLTDGKGVDYSFESTGVKSVMTIALDVVAENGTCIITGVLPMGTKVEFDAWNLLRGRMVKGSIMGDCVPELFIPKLIRFYEEGRFPADKMMKFYALEDINVAIEDSLSGDTIKAVIQFS